MKLRHQAALLIFVPATLQIALTALLWQASVRLETAGRNEMKAKQILAECQQVEGLIGIRTLQISQDRDRTSTEKIDYSAKINDSIGKLKTLVDGNEDAELLIDKIDKNSHLFLSRFEELTDSYVPGNDVMLFARFLHPDEFFESATSAVNHLTADVTELSKIYGPISQEFNPASTSARANLRNTVALAVASNLVLIAMLTVLVNRQALNRLQRLMRNIRTFADPAASPPETLSGNDELTEIDRAFADVSKERRQLDEIRKAMTAMVSHDLRTPLTSMMITLDVMTDVEHDKVDSATLRKLQRLRSETERLRRLANTLLDIEKIESGKVEVNLEGVAVAKLIGTAFNTTADLARSAQIELSSSCTESLHTLCDEDRTVQVLVNLISNAVKFSPPASTIKVNASVNNEFVRVDVVDSGPGVPPDKRDKLFGKFSQLDQPENIRKQGSGLGLYICKMLLEPQDGKIGYESPPSGGSCFWFELPLYGE